MSTGKKIIYSLLAATFALVLLEGGSSVLWILLKRFSPSAESGASAHGLMDFFAPTVKGAATGGNPIEVPDREVLFRVQRNPKGELLFGHSGINKDGFRSDDFTSMLLAANGGKKRVLIVGDSCAFSWGILEAEKTLTRRLSLYLQKAGSPSLVFNLAQPGHSSTQQSVLFRDWVRSIRPDAIVTYMGWNDIWGTPMFTDSQSMNIYSLSHNAVAEMFQESRTYELLALAFKGLFMKTEVASDWWVPAAKPRVPLTEVAENYATFCEYGVPVIVVAPPYHSSDAVQMQRLKNLIAPYDAYLAESVSRSNAVVIRPEAMIAAAAKGPELFQGDGFHPNPEGAEFLANEISNLIVKRWKSTDGATSHSP